MRAIMIWLGGGLLVLLLLVASGVLLADHLTPRATGAPSATLPLRDAQTPIDRELLPYLATHPGQTAATLLHGVSATGGRVALGATAGQSQAVAALDCAYACGFRSAAEDGIGRSQ